MKVLQIAILTALVLGFNTIMCAARLTAKQSGKPRWTSVSGLVFTFTGGGYGTRRFAVELKTGRAADRAAMRRGNLKAIGPRRFVPRTTDSHHDGCEPESIEGSGY